MKTTTSNNRRTNQTADHGMLRHTSRRTHRGPGHNTSRKGNTPRRSAYGRATPTTGNAAATQTVEVSRRYLVERLGTGDIVAGATGIAPAGNNTTLVVSKGILLYTLYTKGLSRLRRALPRRTTITEGMVTAIGMPFLPTELEAVWHRIIEEIVPVGNAVGRNDVVDIWRNFLTEALEEKRGCFVTEDAGTANDHRDATRELLFSTLLQEGGEHIAECFNNDEHVPTEEVRTAMTTILPSALSEQWQGMLRKRAPSSGLTTQREALNIWTQFVTERIENAHARDIERYAALPDTYRSSGSRAMPAETIAGFSDTTPAPKHRDLSGLAIHGETLFAGEGVEETADLREAYRYRTIIRRALEKTT